MSDDEQKPDRLAALSRTHHDGWVLGTLEGAFGAAGRPIDDVMAEMIRRFGLREVERELWKHPQHRATFERVRDELATRDTQPIDIPIAPTQPPSDANSPTGVGGTGEPGGWTGGLTHPPETTTPRRGRRR